MAVKRGPLGEDMTLISVTEDRLAVLQRMRARLSQQIDMCGDERALCLLMTRLQSVMGEIAELDGVGQVSGGGSDRGASRRAAAVPDACLSLAGGDPLFASCP